MTDHERVCLFRAYAHAAFAEGQRGLDGEADLDVAQEEFERRGAELLTLLLRRPLTGDEEYAVSAEALWLEIEKFDMEGYSEYEAYPEKLYGEWPVAVVRTLPTFLLWESLVTTSNPLAHDAAVAAATHLEELLQLPPGTWNSPFQFLRPWQKRSSSWSGSGSWRVGRTEGQR